MPKSTQSNLSGGTGNWSNVGTWNNGVPDTGDSVIISSGDQVQNAPTVTLNSLTLNEGATVAGVGDMNITQVTFYASTTLSVLGSLHVSNLIVEAYATACTVSAGDYSDIDVFQQDGYSDINITFGANSHLPDMTCYGGSILLGANSDTGDLMLNPAFPVTIASSGSLACGAITATPSSAAVAISGDDISAAGDVTVNGGNAYNNGTPTAGPDAELVAGSLTLTGIVHVGAGAGQGESGGSGSITITNALTFTSHGHIEVVGASGITGWGANGSAELQCGSCNIFSSAGRTVTSDDQIVVTGGNTTDAFAGGNATLAISGGTPYTHLGSIQTSNGTPSPFYATAGGTASLTLPVAATFSVVSGATIDNLTLSGQKSITIAGTATIDHFVVSSGSTMTMTAASNLTLPSGDIQGVTIVADPRSRLNLGVPVHFAPVGTTF